MKKKTVQVLAFATAIALGAGIVARRATNQTSSAATGAGAALLPALEEDVNAVARVEIVGAAGSLAFERGDGGWTLPDRGGWPARSEKVRELVLALRAAEVVEQKTSNPDKFAKLGLAEPDAEGARSKRVRLAKADGTTIGEVLIGDRRTSSAGLGAAPQGRPKATVYALTEGADHAVLVRADLNAEPRLNQWAETDVVDIARDRIRGARITRPDGRRFAAARPDSESYEMTLLDVPEGKEPKSPNSTGQFLNAVAGVRFDDVRRADGLDWSDPSLVTAEFFTEDGLRARVETIEVASETDPASKVVWARYAFDVAPEDAPVLPAAETPEASAESDTTGSTATDVADTGDAESDGAEAEDASARLALEREASELTSHTAGWAFAIPSWKSTALRLGPDDVLQDVPAPPAAEAGDGDGADDPSAPQPGAPAADANAGDGAQDETTGGN